MYRISNERDIIRDEIITQFFLNLSKKIQSYIKKMYRFNNSRNNNF